MSDYPPSLNIANLPTPVERMKYLPEFPFLPNVYIKRDDLTGCALSGNKVRKLDFCLAEALDAGADTVITCGGVQSNHARATAVSAARVGLASHLVLRGDDPAESDGNILIDRLSGADIRFITEKEWENIDGIMESMAGELARTGRKAYIIPEGASFPPGVFGYIRAAGEIAAAEKETGVLFDTIVSAAGSGGTYAGLAYGCKVYGLKSSILGINVLETPEYFAGRIARLSEEFVDKYKDKFKVCRGLKPLEIEEIDIAGGYEGPAYAVPTEDGLDLIRTFARGTGIFLDPTYTGKAMLGLIGEAGKGRWKKDENVLFLHTGGLFSLFPLRKDLIP